MTQLSEHFSLEELTFSETASRLGIDNTPTQDLIDHAKLYLIPGLERVRTLLNLPVKINSGYRSISLNENVPGSSNTSQHTRFEAADITCPQFGSPMQIAKLLIENKDIILFDQIILEYNSWCHISFFVTNRFSVLTKKTGTPYMNGLIA